MDINLKIIEQVKKCPQLYQKNSKGLDRQKYWKILSNKMQLDEQFLKSRWYILRERYAKELQNCERQEQRTHFKYIKEMEFVKHHLVLPATSNGKADHHIPDNWIKPEFIITESDLQWKLESDAEGGPIFIISGEEEEQQNSAEQQNIEETVVVEEEVPYDQSSQQEKEHDQITTATEQSDLQNKRQECKTQSNPSKDARKELHLEAERKDIAEKMAIKQEVVSDRDESKITLAEAQSTVGNGNCKKSEENRSETNAAKVSAERTQIENGRCEDSIFGELVAAMLKTMEPSKKKNIKKEIMNLLLS